MSSYLDMSQLALCNDDLLPVTELALGPDKQRLRALPAPLSWRAIIFAKLRIDVPKPTLFLTGRLSDWDVGAERTDFPYSASPKFWFLRFDLESEERSSLYPRNQNFRVDSFISIFILKLLRSSWLLILRKFIYRALIFGVKRFTWQFSKWIITFPWRTLMHLQHPNPLFVGLIVWFIGFFVGMYFGWKLRKSH